MLLPLSNVNTIRYHTISKIKLLTYSENDESDATVVSVTYNDVSTTTIDSATASTSRPTTVSDIAPSVASNIGSSTFSGIKLGKLPSKMPKLLAKYSRPT